MEEFNFIQRIREVLKKGEEEGVTVNRDPETEGALQFAEGEPKTEVQKRIAEEFEKVQQEKAEAFGMTRREFLRSPFAATAATIAIGSVLGMIAFPTQLDAAILDPAFGKLCFAYPTSPFVDFATLPKTNVSGKVAVVIGGSRGIGREMCLQMTARGFDVIGTSRRPEDYPHITEYPLLKVDVTNPGQRVAFARKLQHVLREKGKDMNLLVLNAGRFMLGSQYASDLDAVRLQIESNYLGHVALFQLLEPLYPNGPSDYARLMVASSMAANLFGALNPAFLPDTLGSHYNASKASIRAWALGLQAEQAHNQVTGATDRRSNLKVSVMHPFIYKTGILSDWIIGDDPSSPAVATAMNLLLGLDAVAADPAIAGQAYTEMAELADPYTTSYVVDWTLPEPTKSVHEFMVLLLAEAGNHNYHSDDPFAP